LIEAYVALGTELLSVCNFKVPEDRSLSVDTDFRKLNTGRLVNVMVPLQSSLMVPLPAAGESPATYRPMSGPLPMIKLFRDKIEVMSSLARPKKVTVMGTDQKDYNFLLKPKDDLRKDSRFHEFNSVINKIFKKDPEARKRRLRKLIRNYVILIFVFD
jgi:serine/threonine-protein kinase ATR